MDTLLNSVLFPEDLEYQRYVDHRVRLIDGRRDNELLLAMDNEIVASVELTLQRMIVRDVEGTLIGYFDCPPSGVKEAVLSHCSKRHKDRH